MSKISFCIDHASIALLAGRNDEAPDPFRLEPFIFDAASKTAGAIDALKSGRDVIALAQIAGIGWRAPAGTEVAFDDELLRPVHDAVRAQCEMRVAPEMRDFQNAALAALQEKIASGGVMPVFTTNFGKDAIDPEMSVAAHAERMRAETAEILRHDIEESEIDPAP